MYFLHSVIVLISLSILCVAKQWPHDRYHGVKSKTGCYEPHTSKPESQDEIHNQFGRWFHDIVSHDSTGDLRDVFINSSVPHNSSFGDILNKLNVPEKTPSNVSALPLMYRVHGLSSNRKLRSHICLTLSIQDAHRTGQSGECCQAKELWKT